MDLFRREVGAGPQRFVVAGGVAANKKIRSALIELCEANNFTFLAPPLKYPVRAGRWTAIVQKPIPPAALAKKVQSLRNEFMSDYQNIGVIGGGAWGTALAQTLAVAGRDVMLWALPVVLCSKGIEISTRSFMSDVLAEIAPKATPAVLSGPSFAIDVAKGLPTAVTLACEDEAVGQKLVKAIAAPTFRPYLAGDVLGAEIGGAVKNTQK